MRHWANVPVEHRPTATLIRQLGVQRDSLAKQRPTYQATLDRIAELEEELLKRHAIFAAEVTRQEIPQGEQEPVMRWAGPVEEERGSNKRDVVSGWRAKVKLRESEET